MKKKINKNLIIYQAKNGAIEFRGDFENENVIWANLNQIAELFGVQKPAISKHLKNIYNEGELEKKATVFYFGNSWKRRKKDCKQIIKKQ